MRLSMLTAAVAALSVPASISAQDTHDVGAMQQIPLGQPQRGSSSTPPPATLVVEPVAMMIAACDANGDAVVSHDELTRCVAHSFDSVDTGRKGSIGYITFSDWALMWLGDRTALPSPFETDADADNQITLAELQAKFDAIFTRLDVNKDGKLSRAELLTIRNGLNAQDDTGRRKHRR